MGASFPKQSGQRWRIRTIGVSLAILMVTTWSSGFAQPGFTQAQLIQNEREQLPLAVKVSIGDRELFVRCEGSGWPLVMLESGLGGQADDWSLVQPELARYTRVCAYDRAGEGSSDPDPAGPHSAHDASRDLLALQNALGIDEPVVLVGFSIGGLLARYHAATRPQHVAALVLIDSTPPEWTAMTLSGYSLPARIGGLLEFSGIDPRSPEDLDILKAGEEVFTGSTPRMLVFMLTSGIKSTNPGMYGDSRTRIATKLQEDQARELDAVHDVAEHCGHALPRDCPDEVVEIILDAIDAVRGSADLAELPEFIASGGTDKPRRRLRPAD